MKSKLLEFIPPYFAKILAARKWKYAGNYKSWDEALRNGTGYEAESVISGSEEKFLSWCSLKDKEKESRLGIHLEALDRVVFSAVFVVMLQEPKKVYKILDIGGSLGGHFYLIREALPKNIQLEWDIVETPKLAEVGNLRYKKDGLNWFGNFDDVANKHYDFIFTSGTLQYLENPEVAFKKITNLNHSYLIINRFPQSPSYSDRLTVQTVPKSYYSGSYPAWFFSEEKWLNLISNNYDVKFNWDIENHPIYLENQKAKYVGYILKKVNHF